MDRDKIIENDKKREIETARDALTKSNRELVEQIFFESNSQKNNEFGIISRPLAYFSALLVRLSEQAEESTKKTIKMTRQLLYLTWFIAVLTAVLLFISIFHVPK